MHSCHTYHDQSKREGLRERGERVDVATHMPRRMRTKFNRTSMHDDPFTSCLIPRPSARHQSPQSCARVRSLLSDSARYAVGTRSFGARPPTLGLVRARWQRGVSTTKSPHHTISISKLYLANLPLSARLPSACTRCSGYGRVSGCTRDAVRRRAAASAVRMVCVCGAKIVIVFRYRCTV